MSIFFNNYLAKILQIEYNLIGDTMCSKKQEAILLIQKKLNKDSFLTYKEIAEITGYHPKYVLKLKKEIIEGTIRLEHGNKERKPVNARTEEEKQKIVNLYKRSHASIRKFSRFYGKHSYSCIYNVLKEYNLI